MKINKIYLFCMTLLFVGHTFGQQDSDTKQVEKMKTSTVYKFNYQKNGSSIPYKITTLVKKESPVKLKNEEVKKTNYDRADTPNYVTKLMYVDDSIDDTMDKYIAIRYIEDDSDSFEIQPMDNGFRVIVDNRKAEYVFGEGIYFVNTEDRDFFMVDEFASL